MPAIYKSQKATPAERWVILLVLVLALANYGLRLFHLRLGLVPFEQQLRAEFPVSEADFNWAMSWLEFGLILTLGNVIFALIFLWIMLREIVWRLWIRPSVRLVSISILILMAVWIAATFVSVFLILSPEAAEGTRAAGPRVFTGAMTTGGAFLGWMLVFLFLTRPQQMDQELRVHLRKRT